MAKEYYTTGEVAEICGVSRPTVVRHCDNGNLKAKQSPLSRYRRISKAALLEFMHKMGLSLYLLDNFDKSKR